jgi:hypothetical protein
LASFLVIATLLSGFFWFRDIFLIQRDPFLDFIPIDTTVYWHLSSDDLVLKKWFFDKTKNLFGKESLEKLDFLFNNIDSNNISLAIFPSLRDFVFYTELNQEKIGKIEEKIGEKELFVLNLGNKAAITNNKVILNEIENIKNQEMPSFFSNFRLKMAMNKANNDNSSQIFIKNSFKVGNLPLFFGESNIVDKNSLIVYPQKKEEYDYILALEGDYLAGNIENNVKNTLSYIFPEIRVKKLPDGTRVKELIADSSVFVFKDGENLTIEPLKKDIWLKKMSKIVVLSTDKRKIDDFLARERQKTGPYGKNMFDFFTWVIKKIDFGFNGVIFEVDSSY